VDAAVWLLSATILQAVVDLLFVVCSPAGSLSSTSEQYKLELSAALLQIVADLLFVCRAAAGFLSSTKWSCCTHSVASNNVDAAVWLLSAMILQAVCVPRCCRFLEQYKIELLLRRYGEDGAGSAGAVRQQQQEQHQELQRPCKALCKKAKVAYAASSRLNSTWQNRQSMREHREQRL
jgi:hypothetical protein